MPKDLLYKNRVIGQMPSSWAKVKIDQNLIDILGGFSCPKSRAIASGLPHFRPFNITTEGEVVYTPDTVHIPDDCQTGVDRYFLLEGDVLFNNTNSVELVGKTGIVRQPMQVAFSNHINRLRVRNREQIDPKWLALFLRDLQSRGFFAANCNKWIGQAGFSVDSLSEVDIPLPDIGTQRQIVARIEALLSEVREMREINQNINRDSSQLLAAILKETFPDPQKQAPDQWIWEPLGNRCKTTSGGTPRRGIQDYFNGSIPWIKSGELNDGVIIESEEKITQLAIERSNAKLFPVGTLLIAMYGATIGKLGILGLEAATNQAVCAIFPPPEILPEYLFWYLRRLRKELIYGSFGGAQPNISQTVIRKIQIPIPFYKDIEKSKTEQLRIVDYLKSISEEIVQIQKLSIHDRNLISQLEQSVLAQAFRGEL